MARSLEVLSRWSVARATGGATRAQPTRNRSLLGRIGPPGQPGGPRPDSGALIVVFNPDDVVFPEIAAGLDLDQLQHDLAGVLHPVHRAHRDVDRLVLMHRLHGLVDGDPGSAADHDPVLGPMVVLLQR